MLLNNEDYKTDCAALVLSVFFFLFFFFSCLSLARQTVTNMAMLLCCTTVCLGNHKTNSVRPTAVVAEDLLGLLLFTSPIHRHFLGLSGKPSSPKNVRDEVKEGLCRRVPFHIAKRQNKREFQFVCEFSSG